MKRFVFAALVGVFVGSSSLAQGPASPEPSVKKKAIAHWVNEGRSCVYMEADNSLICRFDVGSDLTFSFTTTGSSTMNINILQASRRGDFYVEFYPQSDCIQIVPGNTPPAELDLEIKPWVSLRNAHVYRSLTDCQRAKYGPPPKR